MGAVFSDDVIVTGLQPPKSGGLALPSPAACLPPGFGMEASGYQMEAHFKALDQGDQLWNRLKGPSRKDVPPKS